MVFVCYGIVITTPIRLRVDYALIRKKRKDQGTNGSESYYRWYVITTTTYSSCKTLMNQNNVLVRHKSVRSSRQVPSRTGMIGKRGRWQTSLAFELGPSKCSHILSVAKHSMQSCQVVPASSLDVSVAM